MKILITGASQGLGKYIADSLSNQKNNVVYGTYNNSIPKIGSNVIFSKVDFNNSHELVKFCKKISTVDIDILINNFHPGYKLTHASKINSKDVKYNFNNYIIPTIEVTNKLIEIFKEKKYGIIINILSSYTITNPPKGLSLYTAEKKFIETFSNFWALELKAFNIFSTSISPGIMDTNFHKSQDPRMIEIMIKNNKTITFNDVFIQMKKIIDNPKNYNGKNILIN